MRYELEGNGRYLVVDDEGVHITNTMKMGRKFEKTIPYAQLVSVEYSNPGRFTGGYLYFQTIGSMGTRLKSKIDMTQDENAVFFMKQHNAIALNIKTVVEEAIVRAKTSANSPPAYSSADELLKLKQLLDAGVLTQGEFDKKKAEILGI